jgi:hypothetical protein
MPLLGGASDIEAVEPEGFGDLRLHELLDRDAGDSPDKFPNEPAERERVISNSGAWLICGLRPCERIGHMLPIEYLGSVVDDGAEAM